MCVLMRGPSWSAVGYFLFYDTLVPVTHTLTRLGSLPICRYATWRRVDLCSSSTRPHALPPSPPSPHTHTHTLSHFTTHTHTLSHSHTHTLWPTSPHTHTLSPTSPHTHPHTRPLHPTHEPSSPVPRQRLRVPTPARASSHDDTHPPRSPHAGM